MGPLRIRRFRDAVSITDERFGFAFRLPRPRTRCPSTLKRRQRITPKAVCLQNSLIPLRLSESTDAAAVFFPQDERPTLACLRR